MKNIFEGIYPALITPFTSDGKINKNSLEKLINMNIDKGVDGFYVCGSTGESFMLSMEERKEYLEMVMEIVNGRVQVIANIGVFSTEHGIELAKHAKANNVTAISSVPPFYFKFNVDEYIKYYSDITKAVDLPMIVYNVPALSGVNFTEEDITKLLNIDGVIGLKHTSYDLFQLERIINNNPDKTVFIGHDEIFLPSVSLGVQAGIGSTFNFMAEKFIELRKVYANGNLERARIIQSEANEIISVLCKIGVFKGVKMALELQGIDCGVCREPFSPLDQESIKLLEKTLKKYNCL